MAAKAIRTPVILCLVAGLALAGCNSRLNPVNWFGRSAPVEVANGSERNPLIPERRASIFLAERETAYLGQPIRELSDLVVEQRPGGAIVRATGIAQSPGRYEARLSPIEEASSDTRLVYSLDIRLYPGPTGTGPRARQVIAATFLTDQDLAGIREIEVRSATNARVSRR